MEGNRLDTTTDKILCPRLCFVWALLLNGKIRTQLFERTQMKQSRMREAKENDSGGLEGKQCNARCLGLNLIHLKKGCCEETKTRRMPFHFKPHMPFIAGRPPPIAK